MAEFGRQPMPPEKLSVIALAMAALTIIALLLPPIPVEPQVWQVGIALVVVWLATFRIQSVRYARFHEHWQRKVLAHTAAATVAGSDARGSSVAAEALQRGRSGQTSGGSAAR